MRDCFSSSLLADFFYFSLNDFPLMPKVFLLSERVRRLLCSDKFHFFGLHFCMNASEAVICNSIYFDSQLMAVGEMVCMNFNILNRNCSTNLWYLWLELLQIYLTNVFLLWPTKKRMFCFSGVWNANIGSYIFFQIFCFLYQLLVNTFMIISRN